MAGNEIRNGILATAESLGISPLDLATAISYETAGTFDPRKKGPRTQWGQHEGLIQFGEPQARKYGVDWNNPVGSQLGPDGAVANYLRDTGVKPGMGLLDVYSAINAGGVGRYGASDAGNGGAPGNVRDKVENQMAGHRAKAAALFGGDMPAYTPPANQPIALGADGRQAGAEQQLQQQGTTPAQPAQTAIGNLFAELGDIGANMQTQENPVRALSRAGQEQMATAGALPSAEKAKGLKSAFMPDLDAILGLTKRPV